MATAAEVTVKISSPIPDLTIDLHLDHLGEWIAQIRGYSGCIGDGRTKQEAMAAAVSLFLHVQILRIQKGEWAPMWRKNTHVEGA